MWRGTVDMEIVPGDLALLDADERERLERMRVPGERARFSSAHAGMRRVFAAYLGAEASAIRFGRARCPRCGSPDHGPPRIVAPETELAFSLSHSGRRWMLAVAPGGPVGIDVEQDAGRDLDAVQHVLSDAERVNFDALAGERERLLFLLRAWTRKEAVCKALGIGLGADVTALEVHPREAGPVEVTFGAGPWDARAWTVAELCGDEDEVAAFARPRGRTRSFVVREVAALLPSK
ncbi:MAG: 4'-phosphopantetheinyl transferase superfamily protein [Candidatus Eremiobacteraeota bacterium]|nr:4'-phosphopantetheinyl transferase superfamily protein [Candidatus Eremiobacteraeota bacterium]